MAESPSTMQHVQYIHYLLNELVERENLQNEAVTAIQNEKIAAIKRVENAIESLHTTYRANVPPLIPTVVPPTTHIPHQRREQPDEMIKN